MFWTPNETVKVKSYVFSGDKQRNNVCLVYLEYKLPEDIYGSKMFQLKCQKSAGIWYYGKSKQQTK